MRDGEKETMQEQQVGKHELQKRKRASPRPQWLGTAVAHDQDGQAGESVPDVKKQRQDDDGAELYPAPLTHDHFELVLQELPTGARLALQTCLSSWRNGNFSTDDFISFIKCYTCYSNTLAAVFDAMAAAATGEKEGGDKGVGASQDQFAHDEMHLDGGDHDCLPRESSPRDGSGGDSGDASEHAVVKVDDDDSAPMPDTSQSVPSQQEITRNMLRRQEALSRRCWGIDGPEKSKLGRFLQVVVRELRESLNLQGRMQLQRIISHYLATSDPEEFSRCINELVDDYQVVVQLPYATAKHGPYIRHVSLAEQRSMVMQQQQAAACAGVKFEMDRRREEYNMLSNMVSMWGPAGLNTGMRHGMGGASGAARDVGGGGLQGHRLAGNARMLDPAPSVAVSCLQLPDTQLSHFLTLKVRSVCPPSKTAVVKVAADTHKFGDVSEFGCDNGGVRHAVSGLGPDKPQGDRDSSSSSGNNNNEGGQLRQYRRKAISLFMSSASAGEVLIFVMYVREHGPDCTEEFASQVCVECVDSTPLYAGEEGTQRQDVLTATLLGYFEWAKHKGFREAILHVPAPAEDRHYIFAYRSLNVRMRTSSHFTTWYQRVLQKGMATGIVHSYRTKSQQLWSSAPPEQGDGASSQSIHGKDTKSQRDSNSPAAMFFSSNVSGICSGHHMIDSTSGTDSTQGNSNSSNSPSSGSGDENNGGSSTNGDSDNGQQSSSSGNCGNDSCGNSQDDRGRGRSAGSSEEAAAHTMAGATGDAGLGTRRCFLVALQDPSRPTAHEPDDEPIMNSLLANRSDLVKFIEREKLKFHSLKHAQVATRRILEALLQQQQQEQQQHTEAAAHAQMHHDAARAGSRLHPAESSATLSLQNMYSAGFGVGVRPSRSLSPCMSGMSWHTYGSGGVRVGGASTTLDGSPGLALSNYDVSRTCGPLPSNSRDGGGMGIAHMSSMSRHDAGLLYVSQPHLHRGRAPGPHAHSYGFPAAYAQSFNPNAQASADVRLPWDGGAAGGGGGVLSNLSGNPLQGPVGLNSSYLSSSSNSWPF